MKSLIYTLIMVPFVLASCGSSDQSESNENNNEIEKDTTSEVTETDRTPPVNKYTIESKIVGVFELGQMVPNPLPEELKMRQFSETDTDDHGKEIEHTHNVIFNMLEDVVELIMERDTGTHHVDKEIVEMIVLSNYYQTPEGIGVGSTIDQFREIYPDMTAWFDKPHGAYYIETESHVGVQFIISDKDIKRKINGGADHQEINTSYFKTGASISRIRVH